ncbi:MAG TPA: DUF4203 domain-containing protein [Candidatus Saccharimonadales bacterium]|nr:DUF4203 domain-containing protein [Candidatus Saccharimonadales bacterium]
MEWLNVLAGLAVLFFGRRLFWLFVGCVGFIVGFELAGDMLAGQPAWVILVVALVVGVLGAIASIFLQRVFVVVAGFFAGGYCLSAFAPTMFHSNAEIIQWVAFGVGGLIGAILSIVLLDPALIILSSLAGATAVSQNVPLELQARTVLFVVLLVLGIAVQTGQYARGAKSPKPQRAE